MEIKDIDTPFVYVDLEKLEENIRDMANFSKESGVSLRPMVKTHKSIWIGKLQENYGIDGIQCAKIGEAEVFSDGGFKDIFISSEIIGKTKLNRLLNLSKKLEKLIVAVDSIEGIRALSETFKEGKIFVRIEIDSGHNRCGVKPEDVVVLAKEIERYDSLILDGVFTHGGQVYSSKDEDDLRKKSLEEAEGVLKAKRVLEDMRFNVNTVSVGSTPSVKISGKVDGITEIRPGNYVFYDMKQVLLGVIPIDRVSLYIVSTVISRPDKDRIIVDAGAKTLSLDSVVLDGEKVHGFIPKYPEARIFRLSEEHGWIKIPETYPIKIGDRLKIIPAHSCLVINNFDEIYGVRNGNVERIIKIDARGKVT